MLIVAGAITVFQSGCSTEPTSPQAAAAPQRRAAFGPTLYLNGPDSISTSGNYTYTASWNALYPTVFWYDRSCSTLTVASCTGTWNQVFNFSYDGSGHYLHTKFLTIDCTGNGTKSYQNKVVASDFGVPAQTVYKTTKLCHELQ